MVIKINIIQQNLKDKRKMTANSNIWYTPVNIGNHRLAMMMESRLSSSLISQIFLELTLQLITR